MGSSLSCGKPFGYSHHRKKQCKGSHCITPTADGPSPKQTTKCGGGPERMANADYIRALWMRTANNTTTDDSDSKADITFHATPSSSTQELEAILILVLYS